jgi:hypothetical protein
MDLQTALDEYHYSVLDLSSKTQVWYDQKLRTFVDWCQGKHENSQKKPCAESLEWPVLLARRLGSARST